MRILIVAFGLLVACDPVDYKLAINNQSKEEIFYKIKRTKDFGDTLLFKKWNLNYNPPDTSYSADFGRIGSKSKRTLPSIFGTGYNTWKKGVQEECEDGMLTVFIFRKSTLTAKPFLKILADNDYKKIRLSSQDLEKIKWTIEVQ
jgi:hypothetical protein